MVDKIETITAERIAAKVKAQEGTQSDLHTRMDADFKRWHLSETIYDEHKTAINVTTNHPRLFANDVQAPLSRAKRQIVVRMAEAEGEDKREDVGKLERLLYFAFEKADERLAAMVDTVPFRDWIIWLFMIRGSAAARILVEKPKDDGVVFNFQPFDPRWMTWGVGKDGFLWAAYKTFRSKADLESAYGKKEEGWLSRLVSNVRGQTKDSIPVIDYWENQSGEIFNAVVCEKELLSGPTPHDLKGVPIIIRHVATRPPIAGDTEFEIKGFGDSIYADKRAIYDLENKLYSIEATRANLLSKQPMINYYKDGGKTVITDTLMQAEGVFNLPMDYNRLEPVPMKEIPMTLLDLSRAIGGMRARGELPHIDIGAPPPKSGTLYGMALEQGEKVFAPQLTALDNFYADACRMVEEQLIEGKYKVKVKTEVDRKYFETQVTPVDLKKPHIIKVKFTAQTPWKQLENYQLNDMAARDGLPRRWRWEHLLELEDPIGLEDMAALEIAEQSPKFAALRAWKKLKAEGRDEEAGMLRQDIDRMAELEGLTGEGEPPPEGVGR